MGDIAAPPTTGSAGIKRYTYAGAALVALAFAGPDLATFFGLDNAHEVGLDFTRTLGSLAVFALIAWMVTRNRSSLAQAKARAVVGVLLCLTFIGSISNAVREEFLVKQFIRDSIDLYSRHAEKFNALSIRFDRLDVEGYLTPDALTSPQHVLAGQAALKRYRSHLAERRMLVQAFVVESTAFVSAQPDREIQRRAESSFHLSLFTQQKIDTCKLLDTTQTSLADALDALLTWAQTNAGMVSMDGEKLTFQNQQLQTELTALLSNLENAEGAVRAEEYKADAGVLALTTMREQSSKEADAVRAK